VPKVAVATRFLKWWWLASVVLALGIFVECYARSLASLILLECPGLGPDAPGHCAHPYWLALCGFAAIGVGLVTLVWLSLLAVLRRRRP
jgi:hypothetical protein